MFKIAATGTLTISSLGDYSTGNANTTLTGLGTYATLPAMIGHIGSSGISSRFVGAFSLANPASWVAGTSGGSPTYQAITFDEWGHIVTSLSSSYCRVDLAAYNYSGLGSTSYYGRYYVLKEAGI